VETLQGVDCTDAPSWTLSQKAQIQWPARRARNPSMERSQASAEPRLGGQAAAGSGDDRDIRL